MRRWTNSPIELTLDEVRELPLEDACGRLGVGDEHFAMVAHTIDDVVGGTLVLMFDKDNGRRLAASLLGKGSQNGGGWSEMEISALTETGNILSCAYVNAITRLIDRRLVPSVPYFVSDYGASVLQQAFAAHASLRDAMLVCRTGFHHAGDELSWLLIFIPTIALREAMEDAFVHLP
ncbi:MAG: chemotaxis protein [Pirellulales bacterium]|nr:chemotaxis protein [Pirellulales bacterium]